MTWITLEDAAFHAHLQRIGAAVRSAWQAGVRRRRADRAARQLVRLDDHLLRDIGIDRAGIRHAVRHGRRR